MFLVYITVILKRFKKILKIFWIKFTTVWHHFPVLLLFKSCIGLYFSYLKCDLVILVFYNNKLLISMRSFTPAHRYK